LRESARAGAPIPGDPTQAIVSYTGYTASTPTTPGHVFMVDLDSASSPTSATCTDLNIDGTNGDLPVTGVAFDELGDTIYASTDFGVLKYNGSWSSAGTGLPIVEVATRRVPAEDVRSELERYWKAHR